MGGPSIADFLFLGTCGVPPRFSASATKASRCTRNRRRAPCSRAACARRLSPAFTSRTQLSSHEMRHHSREKVRVRRFGAAGGGSRRRGAAGMGASAGGPSLRAAIRRSKPSERAGGSISAGDAIRGEARSPSSGALNAAGKIEMKTRSPSSRTARTKYVIPSSRFHASTRRSKVSSSRSQLGEDRSNTASRPMASCFVVMVALTTLPWDCLGPALGSPWASCSRSS